VAGIRELLSRDEQSRHWVNHLEDLGDPDFEIWLPSADELAPILVELAVPHEDIPELIGLLPQLRRTPKLWWLLERCTHSLVQNMGSVTAIPAFPALPDDLGALSRYFYIYVFVATLPHTRAYHRSRGIPPEVSRLTLADLGRNMAVHRRRHGIGGLDVGFWLMLHFRGSLYQLGRLQFDRARLGNRTGNAVHAAGLPYGPGDSSLAVHVPTFYGPLSPAGCDASFEQARRFFAKYFPEESYRIATCHSWLLDDQLAEYLPVESNIVRFQRRFETAYRPHFDDEDILRFVFGRVPVDLAELPQRTVLERAVVGHLRAGRHWCTTAGWLRL
jgi:hypothetical protein